MCPVLFSLEPVPPTRLIVATPIPAARPNQAVVQAKSGELPHQNPQQRLTQCRLAGCNKPKVIKNLY